jgi:hypothetical protein
MPYIEFGEYLPDLPPFKNNGVTIATNVRPGGKSYLSFPSPVVFSTSGMDDDVQGAISIKDYDSVVYNFFGTSGVGDVPIPAKIYQQAGTSFTDVSQLGGYTVSEDEIWEFAQWGNGVVATNYSDNPQHLTLGNASFSDLAGTPPKARHMAVVKDFLVLGNINDAVDGAVTNRLRWSAVGDIEDWSISAVTQADYEDLEETGGEIQAIIGGESGVVFRDYAIHIMTYVGSPVVFQIDKIENGSGLLAPRSIAVHGKLIFYLGRDNFYVFDGRQSIPISTNKINQFFFDNVNLTWVNRIHASIDFDKQIVQWAFPSNNSVNGLCDNVLMYNFSENGNKRWALCDSISTSFFGLTLTTGYTLEELDNVNINLDLLPFSLDSRFWKGGFDVLTGINSDFELVQFVGTAFDATIDTQEIQIYENNRAMVTNVRPIIDGSASVAVYVGTRDNLSESVSFSTPKTPNAAGDFPTRENARYHRFRVTTSGNFNHAQGIDIIEASNEGKY